VTESAPHPGLAVLPERLASAQPVTALAPMQDVTDLPFMTLMGEFGPPDWFFTEFFRVTETSRLETHIVRSITENPTGRPVFAQVIGEHLPGLRRTALELLRLPVAGVDLNLGCPAPKVYKKNVGGGLLRDLPHVDRVLGTLREAIGPARFTVKARIGFEDTNSFDAFLDLVARHRVDLLSIHGRTVKGLYRSEVQYEFIQRAVDRVPCPVLANGDVTSATKAARVVEQTGAVGVMVGRSAIRNPWIFRQIRERFSGDPVSSVPLHEVRRYVDRLRAVTAGAGVPERARVGKMKKYLNFVGQSVDREGRFLHEMRRALTFAELDEVCDRHLLGRPDATLALEPFPGVVARPNCETSASDSPAPCSLDSIEA
jgi:tRNA-dihydrouridine synthase